MKRSIFTSALFLLTVVLSVQSHVFAAAPFVNLQGVGGVAFNPLAYLADSASTDNEDFIGLPRFGGWYVNLSQVNVDWTTLGVADSLFKRLELSYGYETIAQDNTKTKHKSNIGAKLLLVKENSFDIDLLPAISVGSIRKRTSNISADVDATGTDYYLVATKFINKLPLPVLVSAGLLSSKEKVTGVFGFDKEREETGFANIDFVLGNNLIAGFEFKQGARYSDFDNADYWNAHVAWTANKNLSLIGAYVDAGDHKSTDVTGLGKGIVLSAQYEF